MDEVKLSPKEKKIAEVLYAANKPLNANQISKKTGFAWQTTYKYLERMYSRDIVYVTTYGNEVLYWFLASDVEEE